MNMDTDIGVVTDKDMDTDIDMDMDMDIFKIKIAYISISVAPILGPVPVLVPDWSTNKKKDSCPHPASPCISTAALAAVHLLPSILTRKYTDPFLYTLGVTHFLVSRTGFVA
jgi:hypothetical protein